MDNLFAASSHRVSACLSWSPQLNNPMGGESMIDLWLVSFHTISACTNWS